MSEEKKASDKDEKIDNDKTQTSSQIESQQPSDNSDA